MGDHSEYRHDARAGAPIGGISIYGGSRAESRAWYIVAIAAIMDGMTNTKDKSSNCFVQPARDETVAEFVELRLVILSPSFKFGAKWRVSDGATEMDVSIRDEEFLRSVQGGEEVFRHGDILHVTLQTTQWVEGMMLRAESAITKVHGRSSAHPEDPQTGEVWKERW